MWLLGGCLLMSHTTGVYTLLKCGAIAPHFSEIAASPPPTLLKTTHFAPGFFWRLSVPHSSKKIGLLFKTLPLQIHDPMSQTREPPTSRPGTEEMQRRLISQQSHRSHFWIGSPPTLCL